MSNSWIGDCRASLLASHDTFSGFNDWATSPTMLSDEAYYPTVRRGITHNYPMRHYYPSRQNRSIESKSISWGITIRRGSTCNCHCHDHTRWTNVVLPSSVFRQQIKLAAAAAVVVGMLYRYYPSSRRVTSKEWQVKIIIYNHWCEAMTQSKVADICLHLSCNMLSYAAKRDSVIILYDLLTHNYPSIHRWLIVTYITPGIIPHHGHQDKSA